LLADVAERPTCCDASDGGRPPSLKSKKITKSKKNSSAEFGNKTTTINVKPQFINNVNSDGSKTAKVIKR